MNDLSFTSWDAVTSPFRDTEGEAQVKRRLSVVAEWRLSAWSTFAWYEGGPACVRG